MVGNKITRQFSTRSNIFASVAGNAIVAVAYLVAIPLYLPYIGVEAYGLVGLFVALQIVLTVLDLGLSVTLNRELAICSSNSAPSPEMADLLRTTEGVTWSFSALIAATGIVMAPILTSITNPQHLSPGTLRSTFVALGVALALHFPTTLYSGGMYGMQRQALVSAIFVFFSLLKTFGVLAILEWVSPTPEAFFIWQAVCAGAHSITLAAVLRAVIPNGGVRGRFRPELLRNVWKFTAGIGAITIISALISQVDKFVLVRVLSLEAFGYYSIAAVLSANVQKLIQPVYQAYFPKLSQAANRDDNDDLSRIYHQGSQLIAVIVLPFCMMFVFFSPELIFLWQGDLETVANTWLTVAILMAGSGLNALLFLPYALQLAHGWTKLQIVSQLAVALVVIPLTIFLATEYGGPGAAVGWIVFNLGLLLFAVPVMHRRLLKTEQGRWYLRGVILPLAAAIAAASVARLVFIEGTSNIWTVLQLGVVYAATLAATIMACREMRTWIRGTVLGRRYSINGADRQ